MENSLGSRYYKNQQKRDAQVKERITKMQQRLQFCNAKEKETALHKADEIIKEIENERNLSRTIIHIDMDAFYASVEERDQPALKSKPMAVGGMSMLSTSNYAARKYGVRAAMPGFIAMKLCPELTIVPLNFLKYKQVSGEIQKICAEYDENYLAASLDEAYLDVTDHLNSRVVMSEAERTFEVNSELVEDAEDSISTNAFRTFGFSAEEVAEEIRFRIHQKTKLTASAGIGPNLMLAKIGSDLNKPNGQTTIPFDREEILKFMKDLPLRKVSGIGKVSEQLLLAFGINTCGDLITHRANVVLLFSNVSSLFFLKTGLGCSSNHVCQDGVRKSISTERTFNAMSNKKELFLKLDELCDSLADDLKKSCVQGKTVTLKIKTIDFERHTRSKSSVRSIFTKEDLYDVAKELLQQEIEQSPKLALRLMGVGLSKLEPVSGNKQVTIKNFFNKTGSNEPKIHDFYENHCSKSEILSDANKETDKDKFVGDVGDSSCEASTSEYISNESPTSAAENHLVCPVCSKDTFSDLAKLNSHLDKCLVADKAEHKTKSENNDVIAPSLYSCPICMVAFDASATSLQDFNNHVDTCLNRKTIKEMLKQEAVSNGIKNQEKTVKRRKLNTGKQSGTIKQFFS